MNWESHTLCSPCFALGGVCEHVGKESDTVLSFTPTKTLPCARHLTSKLERIPSFGGKETLARVQMALELASFWQRQTEMRPWHFEAHRCFSVHRHMKEAEPSCATFEVWALPLVRALKWPIWNIPNGKALILWVNNMQWMHMSQTTSFRGSTLQPDRCAWDRNHRHVSWSSSHCTSLGTSFT